MIFYKDNFPHFLPYVCTVCVLIPIIKPFGSLLRQSIPLWRDMVDYSFYGSIPLWSDMVDYSLYGSIPLWSNMVDYSLYGSIPLFLYGGIW